MAKKKKKRLTRDGLRIVDKQFGVSADAHALHEEFSEKAEVAEILFAARKAAGLTQKQLAEAVGTTQQVISQLEDADYEGHSLSMLRRIAAAFGSRVEIRLVPGSPEKIAV
jgi:DNA-binding XRE family transcriptional regulator